MSNEAEDHERSPTAGSDMTARIQKNLKSMGTLDKVVLGGSAVLLLCSFFRWFGNRMGGVNGWEDYHVLGLLACIGAIAVTLLRVQNPNWIQMALAGSAWALGPFAYWLHFDSPDTPNMGGMPGALRKMMEGAIETYSLSHTFMFWVAFLAGLAAAGAAGWKLWEEMQKGGATGEDG